MLLNIRASAPQDALRETVLLTLESGTVRALRVVPPASAPVTLHLLDPQQVQLGACNGIDLELDVAEGQQPRLRLRIQTGLRCDVTVMADNQALAAVGERSDQTFVVSC